MAEHCQQNHIARWRVTANVIVTVEREFDTPRERVFRAWTRPEELAQWRGSPGWHVEVETVRGQLELGGRHFHVKVRDADATTRVATDGVYTEFFEPDVFVARERRSSRRGRREAPEPRPRQPPSRGEPGRCPEHGAAEMPYRTANQLRPLRSAARVRPARPVLQRHLGEHQTIAHARPGCVASGNRRRGLATRKRPPEISKIARGGFFAEPPRVAAADGQLFVHSGTDCWLLAADAFGATFHRASAPEAEGARPMMATLPRRTQLPPEAGEPTSIAATPTTLAVTTTLTHRVLLYARSRA